MGSQQPDEETPLGRVHAAALALSAAKGARSPVVVGIDGRSGSGKTGLADGLAARLGWPVLHLDDLYQGWDGLPGAPGTLAADVLIPLRQGRDGSHPTWDWAAGRPGPRAHLPWAPRLVVEGCGTGAGPAGGLLDLLVWLEAPADLRRERALERDGDLFAPHWERWAEQEDAVLAGVRERADLVLDTTRRCPPRSSGRRCDR